MPNILSPTNVCSLRLSLFGLHNRRRKIRCQLGGIIIHVGSPLAWHYIAPQFLRSWSAQLRVCSPPSSPAQAACVRVRGSYFGVILSFTAECGNYFTNCGRGCHKRCPTRTNQKDLKRKLIIFSAWISNLTMKFYHHNLENKISTYIEATNTDAIYSGFRFSWLDLQFFEANL